MRKRLLLLFAILAMAINASAYDFEVDGIYYDYISQDELTCAVTYKDNKYNSYSGDIVIPSTVTYSGKAHSVIFIGGYAFAGCSSLTSVEIPNSVTYIGLMSFSNCSSLTSVEIPNSVTSIGVYAFQICSGLTSVKIPNSVTEIGDGAFKDCSNLTSAEIPNSVIKIGWRVFSGCSSLASVEIPKSVTSIGVGAFSNCSSLTSVEIPNSVTEIGDGAFSNCSSLESFSGKFATEDHRCLIVDGVLNSVAPVGLTSYTIPNSVTLIGGNAFCGCSSLTSVVIPNFVTSIGDGAFRDCSSLTSVEIPNSVSLIKTWVFYGCSSLTSVVIPNSVTSIGGDAFRGCSSLTSVLIPSSVTSIGEFAFESCSSLTSVVIPNSIISIGQLAFSKCTSLISVDIPNSVTWIGYDAFEGCSSLTSVVIPNSVTSIGDGAFRDCSSLTSVEIPNSVTKIGEVAFGGCSSLTSVVIPNSVTEISGRAFSGCTSLKEITSLAVTPPSIQYSTFGQVSKEECMLMVPKESLEAYMTAEYWREFFNIVGVSGEGGGTEPETKQCEAPTIELVDGKLVVTSTTEGATCNTSITSDDIKCVASNDPIELTGIYNISSYACADGYKNSETVTATLIWVNPTLETDNILSMEARKAVLIRTQGGNIIVSGTEQGESIQLYSTDGRQLRNVSAEDGQTVVPCNLPKGEVVIVKYGDKAVKVLM